ncbi:uncharacterized protein LOC143901749 [Temnothorax americanus]|uniref:uncharacterized protein LOC143901749 n=1 Tax=Temnothorax americanus TaxID=1964332 RepID=UPI004068B749
MSCDVQRAKHTVTMMMTTDSSLLPFIMKKERTVCNDSDSDINSDNIGDFSSVPLPSLSKNTSVRVDDANTDFLRLTTMVRTVYSSYLHKCLLTNYATCYKQTDDADDDTNNVQRVEVKKCADQMELYAVHCALEASLYRQNMLRLIADVKSHTVKKKAYTKLVIFLQAPKDRRDRAIQTDEWMDLEETNIQTVSLTKSNREKPVQVVAVPTATSSSSCENRNTMEDFYDETDMQQRLQSVTKEDANDASQGAKDQRDSHTRDNDAPVRTEDETSQDSLLQHMQDMFCESDDSSDLTRLIEKHSGVTKATIAKEINKICLEADRRASSNLFGVPVGTTASKPNVAKVTTSEGKISFSRYKELQSRRSIKLKGRNVNETVESKQKQKASAIWFVERVHQVSKLKAKMTELSLTNYRRHGRVKEKFLCLFGDAEDEEMMPASPICIEEHLPACKERIAPWIVKYLMPFYKKRRIKDRQLFKAIAKYITDMLIIEKTFPEQECVRKYIEAYFKNKRSIKTKQDIYL